MASYVPEIAKSCKTPSYTPSYGKKTVPSYGYGYDSKRGLGIQNWLKYDLDVTADQVDHLPERPLSLGKDILHDLRSGFATKVETGNSDVRSYLKGLVDPVLGKTDIIKREAPSVDGLLSYISDQPNGIFTPVNEEAAAFSANPVMHLLKFKMQD